MEKTREEIIDKIEKMEALAKSTSSPSEAEVALSMARKMRKKYEKILVVPTSKASISANVNAREKTQPSTQKYWFHKKFVINNIKIKRYRELIANIRETSNIPQEDDSEIKWVAEIFSRRIFLFFIKRRVDLHIVFSSTTRFTLESVIQSFLRISGLDIR